MLTSPEQFTESTLPTSRKSELPVAAAVATCPFLSDMWAKAFSIAALLEAFSKVRLRKPALQQSEGQILVKEFCAY
jgi:hypothetical protein